MAGMVGLALPRFALIFYSNAWGKRLYSYLTESGSPPHKLVGTGDTFNIKEVLFAGLFSQLLIVPLLVAPLERVKVLMQTNTPKRHAGQLACLSFVTSNYGFRDDSSGSSSLP